MKDKGQRSRKAAPFVRTVPAASSTRHHDHPDATDVSMNQSNSASGRRFRAGDDEEDVDVEEQMDWIGGKLAQLIEEGIEKVADLTVRWMKICGSAGKVESLMIE